MTLLPEDQNPREQFKNIMDHVMKDMVVPIWEKYLPEADEEEEEKAEILKG